MVRFVFYASDKGKFGFKLLQKMGWSEGKGLGANEDGSVESIKMHKKDDNMGLGASKKNIDNWLENSTNFDALLERLADGENVEKKRKEKKKSKKESDSKKRESSKNEPEKKKAKTEKKEKENRREKDLKEKTKRNKKAISKVEDRLYFKRKLLKGKNVSNYAENDLKAIFGVK